MTRPATHWENVGVCYFPDKSAREVASMAMLCEGLGFGFLGIGDVQGLWSDVYVGLALAGEATRSIRIGPWVTNPVTRHSTVTANTLRTLDALYGGRLFLGIGVGDGAVRTIGQKPATIAELSAAIANIRQQLTASGIRPASLPVYWAAAGDRSTLAGARQADGVVVSGWITPELLADSRALVAEGASGRPDVLPIFNTAIVIDDDRDRALAMAKPYVARALARPSAAKVSGWTADDVERFRRAYDFKHHFRSDHELGALVPAEMVQKKAIAGTPADCAMLLRRIFDAGFQQIAVIPMGEPERTLRRLAEEVLPMTAGG